jgi:hypothetical protein
VRYVLYGVAIVAGSLALFFAFLFGVTFRSKGVIEVEAQRWVDRELPAVLSSWKAEDLEKRAAPEFVEANGTAKIAADLAAMRARFGAMRQYTGSEVGVMQGPSPEGDRFVRVIVNATAFFDRGEGRFVVGVVRREGRWAIVTFSATDAKAPEAGG